MYPTSNLSLDDRAREFYVTYTDDGGELSSVDFANDTTSTHFIYDAYIYLADPSQVQNIEMDMNQVLADGKTVILATQCSSNSNSWEWSRSQGVAELNGIPPYCLLPKHMDCQRLARFDCRRDG